MGVTMKNLLKLECVVDFDRDIDDELEDKFMDKLVDLVEEFEGDCFMHWIKMSNEDLEEEDE